MAISYYQTTFNGEPSTDPKYWSAFGSYIGGIFSPLIAFCTIPILGITVFLQWQIIVTQQREFLALHRIQEKQLKQAESDSEFQRINSYKQTILTVINQQLDSYKVQKRDLSESLHASKVKTTAGFVGTIDSSEGAVYISEKDLQKRFDKMITQLRERIHSHTNLSAEIAVKQFSTMQEFIDHYRDRIELIMQTQNTIDIPPIH
ncbi:hypothetical protein R50076_15380 [Gilvimarinus japonicus]